MHLPGCGYQVGLTQGGVPVVMTTVAVASSLALMWYLIFHGKTRHLPGGRRAIEVIPSPVYAPRLYEKLKVMKIDSAQSDHDDSLGRWIIEAGSELVGVTSGVALGLYAGGPDGALAGAAAGSALKTALREFAQRVLGPREQVRVGAALLSADAMYRERITAGHQLRDDGWFYKRPRGRSAAAEMLEGTLFMAQREHEERKVDYYGYLLANLSFQSDVDEYLANWLVQLADELTWGQLVLLAMVGRKDEFTLPAITVANTDVMPWSQWGLHEQLANLGYGQRSLIGNQRKMPESKPGKPQFTIPARIERLLPNMQLVNTGPLIYALMALNRIPSEDIELLISYLDPGDEEAETAAPAGCSPACSKGTQESMGTDHGAMRESDGEFGESRR
jgi:hypothetical protein